VENLEYETKIRPCADFLLLEFLPDFDGQLMSIPALKVAPCVDVGCILKIEK
jgi:hypothetical protein